MGAEGVVVAVPGVVVVTSAMKETTVQQINPDQLHQYRNCIDSPEEP